MKKKIIRLTTVPQSLGILLKGQLCFMNKYFEVIAISSNNKELLKQVGENEGVRVCAVNMTRKITPYKDLLALFILIKLFRKEKPHIVHTHTPKAGTLGMVAAKISRVPHRLHTVAGLPLLEATKGKRLLLNIVEKITYWCATSIYPNSKGLENIIIENKLANKKKLKVIGNGSSNGIDTSFFNPELMDKVKATTLKKSLHFQENGYIFVFVGRLVGDKGINELIKAFKRILFLNASARLLLVGDFEDELDPLNSDTKNFILRSDHVCAVGWQNDVRPFLSIADCLVFPSYREGFPNVVMQAGAMGLYSIVSDINGCNEIIIPGENGLLIPPKNIEALKKAMEFVIENNEVIIKAKSKHRKMIQDRFEREFVWQELLKEYKKLSNL